MENSPGLVPHDELLRYHVVISSNGPERSALRISRINVPLSAVGDGPLLSTVPFR